MLSREMGQFDSPKTGDLIGSWSGFLFILLLNGTGPDTHIPFMNAERKICFPSDLKARNMPQKTQPSHLEVVVVSILGPEAALPFLLA